MEWWDFIKQFFSDDFFYWFYSALVQAFAAMIAVLGMFIVHSIQVRKQDKSEINEHTKKILREVCQDFNSISQITIISDQEFQHLELWPDKNLKSVEADALNRIRHCNKADSKYEKYKAVIIKIKKFDLNRWEINNKYRSAISEGRSILVLPFLAFLISVVGLLFANVLKYYSSFGIVITFIFTGFIIYMVWHIKGKSNYLIKTGIDYLSEEELNKQAQEEVEAEIEKS